MNEKLEYGGQQFDQKIPILDAESIKQFDVSKLNDEWNRLTEVIRQDMQEDESVRRALIVFCHEPVNEHLGGIMMERLIGVDERLAKLLARYKDNLGFYLKIDAVPEEQITPDVTNAPKFKSSNEVYDSYLKFYDKDPDTLDRLMYARIDSSYFQSGLTDEEKDMVIRRFEFARDVKRLALAAEIIEKGIVSLDDKDSALLQSGIEISINQVSQQEKDDILNPIAWEKRKQLKDRVYEIEITGRRYLIKEKKTKFHTDTKEGGHIEGNSSVQEFMIAKDFQEKGVSRERYICVGWEQPIGVVTYPDGFQFSLFRFEEGLIGDESIRHKLCDAILNNEASLREEYEKLLSRIDPYLSQVLSDPFEEKEKSGLVDSLMIATRLKNPAPPKMLSFQEFARVKSYRMIQRAREELRKTILDMKYENSDLDGYAFRIHAQQKVQLEIIGFDFEYMFPIDDETAAFRQGKQNSFAEYLKKDGLSFVGWSNGGKVTSLEKAAYFALVDLE